MKRVGSYLKLAHASPIGNFMLANWRGVVGLLSLFAVFLIVKPQVRIQASRPTIQPAELLMVQAVFRHGARTPLSTLYWPQTSYVCKDAYPGVRVELFDETGRPDPPPILDLNMPKLPGGCRMGQLTQTGYHMALDLGAWLRRRYTAEIEFLSPEYTEWEVSVRSTCIQRAVQTLQGVATGLWPDLAADAPGRGLRVNASREAREFMYGKNTTCAALTPLYAALQAGLTDRDAHDKGLAQLAQEVADALDLDDGPSGVNWLRLHDTLAALKAEYKANYSSLLPPQLTHTLTQQIFQQAVAHEAPVLAPLPSDGLLPAQKCTKTVRLAVGPLLWRLSANMLRAWSEVMHHAPSKTQPAAAPATNTARPKAGGGASTATEAGDETRAGPEHRLLRGMQLQQQGTLERAAGAGGGSVTQGMQGDGAGPGGEAGHAGLRSVDMKHQQHKTAVQEEVGPAGAAIAEMAAAAAAGRTSVPPEEDLGAVHTTRHAATQRHLSQAPGSPVSPPHAYLYSGHDSTITPLLAALGKPEDAWPPFTAVLVFELWSTRGQPQGSHSSGGDTGARKVRVGSAGSTGEPVVRVLYNKEPLELEGAGTSPGGFISLGALMERWEVLTADDEARARECVLPAAEKPAVS